MLDSLSVKAVDNTNYEEIIIMSSPLVLLLPRKRVLQLRYIRAAGVQCIRSRKPKQRTPDGHEDRQHRPITTSGTDSSVCTDREEHSNP